MQLEKKKRKKTFICLILEKLAIYSSKNHKKQKVEKNKYLHAQKNQLKKQLKKKKSVSAP